MAEIKQGALARLAFWAKNMTVVRDGGMEWPGFSYGDAEWLRFAHRVCRQTERGIEFDYDMSIVEPFAGGNTGKVPDGWPFYRALAGRPVLVLRGGNSDLLSDAALERMATEIPNVEVVTVPGVGHAPDLDEPESVAGIDRLLDRVLRR